MSLIFQTLGKLDAAKTGHGTKEEPVKLHQEEAVIPPAGGAFRRVLWLSGGIALVLVILGFGAVLSVYLFSSHGKVNPVYAANTIPTVEVPAQPIMQPVDENPSSVPRFVPPDLDDSDAKQRRVAADEKNTSSTGSTIDTLSAADGNGKIFTNGHRREHQDDFIPQEQVHFDSKRAMGANAASTKSQGKTVAEEHVKTLSALDPSTPEQRQIQAAHRLARQKSERISRIVQKLEAAVSQMPGNASQIEALLNDLAQVKGANSNYVAKMRAFWLLKQEKYEQAETILKKISAIGGADPEVGINLAIIDLHKGNRFDALQRLSQLRKNHPDNTYIADLLRKLQ